MSLTSVRAGAIASALTALTPGTAIAHAPGDGTVLDPWVVVPMAIAGGLYVVGSIRSGLWRRRHRTVSFAAGWLVLAAALIGPVERFAHASLAGHMAQHMLLLTIAPPLLLWGRPLPVLLQGLPRRIRRNAAPLLAGAFDRAGRHAVLAFLVHGAVIWLWHLPLFYEAALADPLLHHLEHATFLLSALWFWWTLLAPAEPGREGFGTASLLAALTVLHTGMLGAILTFASVPLYPSHPAGFGGYTGLEDQQLAGLIMWVPGGMLYAATALVLWLKWQDRHEQWSASG